MNSTVSEPAKAVSQPEDTGKSTAKYSFYQKIFFLYFLNLIDWICTEALISSGRFYEANPVMRPVLTGFVPTLLIKGILPLMLTLLCCAIYRAAGIGESRLADILLNTGIIVYAAVNLWHIVNFLLLFSAF